MRLPEIQNSRYLKTNIVEFKGLNKNPSRISTGEFTKIIDMSNDRYPALSNRNKRYTCINDVDKILGTVSMTEDIYYVATQDSGIHLFKNGEIVTDSEGNEIVTDLSNTEKSMLVMGAYILIWPDKKMFNTYDLKYKDMEYKLTYLSGINLYLSDKNGYQFVFDTTSRFKSWWVNTDFDDLATRDNKISQVISGNEEGFANKLVARDLIGTVTKKYVTSGPVNAYPANIVFGADTWVKSKQEFTTYNIYMGEEDSDGKIRIKGYNPSTSAWSEPDLYVTVYFEGTRASELFKNIEIEDFIKLHFRKEIGKDIEKEKEKESIRKFLDFFDNYAKVENIIYDESNPNRIGIVFGGVGRYFLDMLNTLSMMTFGNTTSSTSTGEDKKVKGVVDATSYLSVTSSSMFKSMEVSRDVPDMNFMTVSQNRVWGCSDDKHEIYACKLGDPTNWHTFAGLVSDSYAATIGSSGKFTGAFTYDDCPVFFKNNRIINIYGNRPANYQLKEIETDGVEEGSDKSIAYADGVLFYKSKRGIMKYDGGYPTLITEAWGEDVYIDGVGGAVKGKYYLEVKDKNNDKHLFVYNMSTRTLLEEKSLDIKDFTLCSNNLYAVTDEIVYIEGNSKPAIKEGVLIEENEVESVAITGDIIQSLSSEAGLVGYGISNQGLSNKFYVTFELDKGARLKISVQYDNDKSWTKVIDKKSSERFTYYIPVLPRRCQKMRLKFEGQGNIRIYEITMMNKQSGGIL